MSLDTSLLCVILGLLFKASLSLNTLENRTVKHETKLEYLEKHLTSLEREFRFEFKPKNKDED